MINGMDEFTLGLEYNAPVDVEATLNSLLESSPNAPYDFSASLISSSPSLLRNSVSALSSMPILKEEFGTQVVHPHLPLHVQHQIQLQQMQHLQQFQQVNPQLQMQQPQFQPFGQPMPQSQLFQAPSTQIPQAFSQATVPQIQLQPPKPSQQDLHQPTSQSLQITSRSYSPQSLSPQTVLPQSLSPQSAPECDSSLLSTAAQLDAKRKRRRKDDVFSEEVCKGFDWTVYQSPQNNYIVCDTATMQPMGDNLDISAFKSGSNSHYSATEKAWICYRQNQFKVFCLLKMPQMTSPICVRDGAMDQEVRQLYAKLYAIKSTTTGIGGEEVQVGLYHAGKSRVKKEKTEINAVPFVDGKAEFANLQFERSNAVKGQQEYFHIVITLYAKTSAAFYPVVSKISPRMIVRSQHPGFYGPPSPTDQTSISSEENSSPKTEDNEQTWQQGGTDSVFHMGKVGINTSEPTEALTVHGNAIITGNLFKPSDRRIKSDFENVDSSEQLEHIRNLKIYDYKVQDREERGVIAQELQEVMPPAVHVAGDVNINGVTVENLLVVNERTLLYENIGATQQLDKNIIQERHNIVHIDQRVHHLANQNAMHTAEMKGKIRYISDMLFAEEISSGTSGEAWREEQVIFGLNLFRMGPARSIMVLGYFFQYLWLAGGLFIFSNMRSRVILGRACLVHFLIWYALERFLFDRRGPMLINMVWIGCAIVGLSLLLGNWRRNKKRMKMRGTGIINNDDSFGWKCWEWTFLRRSPDDEEIPETERFLGPSMT